MKTTWQNQAIQDYESLSADKDCDVVVIGAGATGTSVAYQLAKTGKRVIVLDKGTLDKSVTAYTTGFLACDIDTDTPDLVKMFGKAHTRDIWQSHSEAIDTIEDIAKHENIECEYMRVPEYFCATTTRGTDRIKAEANVVNGFGFSMKKTDGLAQFENAYVLERQAKFHPLKYFDALRSAATNLGVHFYDHTEVIKIEGEKTVHVTTKKGTITANAVVIATYLPFENKFPTWPKKGMYVSYVYELAIPKGAIPEGLYLDDHNPYHYFRIDAGKGPDGADRMIIGGEDRRKEVPINQKKCFAALTKYMKKYFPDLRYTVVTKWAGPILETADGLPHIGRYDNARPNRYLATGFSGNGMTYSTIAAHLITDLIAGNKNRYAHIYDPYRPFTLTGLWIKTKDYVGEFAGGVFKNYFVKK